MDLSLFYFSIPLYTLKMSSLSTSIQFFSPRNSLNLLISLIHFMSSICDFSIFLDVSKILSQNPYLRPHLKVLPACLRTASVTFSPASILAISSILPFASNFFDCSRSIVFHCFLFLYRIAECALSAMAGECVYNILLVHVLLFLSFY